MTKKSRISRRIPWFEDKSVVTSNVDLGALKVEQEQEQEQETTIERVVEKSSESKKPPGPLKTKLLEYIESNGEQFKTFDSYLSFLNIFGHTQLFSKKDKETLEKLDPKTLLEFMLNRIEKYPYYQCDLAIPDENFALTRRFDNITDEAWDFILKHKEKLKGYL